MSPEKVAEAWFYTIYFRHSFYIDTHVAFIEYLLPQSIHD